MTNPPGPYPPEGYGPPPLGPQHPMGGPGHRFPPTVQQPARDQQAPQAYVPGPRLDQVAVPPPNKGFLSALFDMKFDHMVTPTLIKLFYALAMLLASGSALIVGGIGLWVLQLRNGWLLGLLILLSAPIFWVFEVVLARIVMEAVVVQFKSAEYLRVIKDKI